MVKVLIVDDEEVYRIQLSLALLAEGYEIKTAVSGREAVDVGARFRPDVVLTDWMLKNHIHGLHVAEVLRLVKPDMRSILVTGFPSKHLREAATRSLVQDFIEKPFRRDQVLQSVLDVCQMAPICREVEQVAVMEVDNEDGIVYANERAKQLLLSAGIEGDGLTLHDVLDGEQAFDLDKAVSSWAAVPIQGNPKVLCHVRAQGAGMMGSRLLVIRPSNEPQYMGTSLIEMLLGLDATGEVIWPFASRVLIIDDDPLLWRVFTCALESTGAVCYASDNIEEIERIIRGDDGLNIVVHDYEIAGLDPCESIKRIKSLRPGVRIVGTSAGLHQEDFLRLGVGDYLHKPWKVQDLIKILGGPGSARQGLEEVQLLGRHSTGPFGR